MITSKQIQRTQARRELRQRRVKLFQLIAAALVLIAAAFLLANQQPYAAEVTGRPNLVVDQTLLDFGTLPLNQTVEAVFLVRNTGDQPLEILNQPFVRVAEGCCPPDLEITSLTIKPGRESLISMTFMMHEGMDGEHDFRILLETNDPTQPEKELAVLSNWE